MMAIQYAYFRIAEELVIFKKVSSFEYWQITVAIDIYDVLAQSWEGDESHNHKKIPCFKFLCAFFQKFYFPFKTYFEIRNQF